MKTFVTIFLDGDERCVLKDPGMIPYSLHKFLGYDSYYASYNSDYSYSKDYVPGLKMIEIKKRSKRGSINCMLFLLKYARKIDVLNMYFLIDNRNALCLLIYKLLNPKGIFYVKMDASVEGVKTINYYRKGLKGKIWRWIINKYDIISAETTKAVNGFRNEWGLDIKYIPNGYLSYSNEAFVKYEDKKNAICAVGRLGAYPKNTKELVVTYRKLCEKFNDWELWLVGPMEKDFNEWIDTYIKENECLKNKIVFFGDVESREKLEEIYASSKIFALTSEIESFGIVLVEAQAKGCYIVASDVGAASDVIEDNKYGIIYDQKLENGLYDALSSAIDAEEVRKNNCKMAQQHAKEHFNWENIARKLDMLIEEHSKR